MYEFLDKLRQKPKHVRQQIAFGTAAATSGVVALLWMLVFVTSGPFSVSLKSDKSLAQSASSGASLDGAVAETKSSFTRLLGAAGASFGATTSEPKTDSKKPNITIVDVKTSSSTGPKDQTVIPF
ncbi:MAG: hypothetical protein WAV21_00490 [Minisyncoccia bacterium]